MSETKMINDRQRRFAEWVVSGLDPGRAYEEAGFRLRGRKAEAAAGRMLEVPAVKEYVAELREKARAAAKFGLEEMVAFCVGVIRARPCEAALDNPLCEMRMGTKGAYALFPAKKDMLDRLAKILGLDQPKKGDDREAVEQLLRDVFAPLRSESALPDDRDEM
jgi:hypothetical protein